MRLSSPPFVRLFLLLSLSLRTFKTHPASRKAEALIKKLVPVQEMKPRASYPGWAYLCCFGFQREQER